MLGLYRTVFAASHRTVNRNRHSIANRRDAHLGYSQWLGSEGTEDILLGVDVCVRAQGARVLPMGWWVVDYSLEAIPRTFCLPWLCFLVVHSQVGTFFSPDVLGVFVGVASPTLQLMRISGQSLARPCIATYVRAYARCTLGACFPRAV